MLQEIIYHGADVNAKNKSNETPLMAAFWKANEDAVNVLLNAGADPNIADDYGETCLHDAVRGGYSKKILQAIINYGADVNATNKNNRTALMIACKMGNIDVICVLLNAGANPHIADNDGNTCLHDAVDGDCNKEVLQAIISQDANINATDKDNVTALMIASWNGNVDAINVLLNAGADPHIADANGYTCLHNAVSGDCSKEVLQEIISHNANINATNKNNVTALMIACWNGNEEAINVLLSAGADPHIADANGYKCLHSAVIGDYSKDILQIIIHQGSDVNAESKINSPAILGAGVNAVNKGNVTALMLACGKGNAGAVQVLLNAGANPNIMDCAGDACLHYTVDGECSIRGPEEYIDHCSDVNATNIKKQSSLILVCATGNAYALSVLLNWMADPNLLDTGRDTLHCNPVHSHISEECLQAVVDLGAEIDLYTVKDDTVSDQLRTCTSGHRESMNLLLQEGADTNINVFGDTCLHRTLHREYLSLEYDHETLQMLLDHGAPVNATNKNNQTAYMLASHQGNIDAICALLNAGANPSIISTDGDASFPHTDNGCSSSVCLQTILHWLNPAWHYLDLPSLEITDSLMFNLVPRIFYSMMRHSTWQKMKSTAYLW